MKRIWWFIGLGAVVVAALLILYFAVLKHKDPPRYETVQVQKSKVVAKVTASGTLSAIVTVQVGAQVSGRIAEIPKGVDYNSKVTKGEVIAKIDPQLFQASVEQNKANYDQAVATLDRSKIQAVDAVRQATREKALLADKLVAQQDYDTLQATADAAVAQVKSNAAAVEQALASLHQAQVNLDYTTIVSPIDGVVILRAIDVGQTVASSLQTPTLFTIAEDLRKMQVDTSVAEADVGHLRDAMPATFTVDAYPGERFNGIVRQIRSAPQTVQNVVTYDAVIDLENPELRPGELKLKPGMTANCTFIWAERDNVLAVPNAALRFRPPNAPTGRGHGGMGGGGGGAMAGGGGEGGGRGGHGGSDKDGGAEVAAADGDAGPRHHRRHADGDGQGDGNASADDGSAGAGDSGKPQGGYRRDGRDGTPPPSADGVASASSASQPASQPSSQPASQPHHQHHGSTMDDSLDRRTVWVLRGTSTTPLAVPVRTGITDGSFTEILEGDLHEGDTVITDLASGDDSKPSSAQQPPGGGRRLF